MSVGVCMGWRGVHEWVGCAWWAHEWACMRWRGGRARSGRGRAWRGVHEWSGVCMVGA